MTIETLTSFFGWMIVINFGLLTVFAVLIIAMRNWSSRIHARMFGLDAGAVRLSYFYFIAGYEVLAFVFCLVPWLALKML